MEQLISLGADVKVTLRQEDTLAWPLKEMPYPCVLSERGKYHWVAKVKHLGMLQTRSEALSGSTFNLIHLAVCPWPTDDVPYLGKRSHVLSRLHRCDDFGVMTFCFSDLPMI